MQLIRRMMAIPPDRRLILTIPPESMEQEMAEVIVIVHGSSDERARKINLLAQCEHDKAFQEDQREIAEDFAAVDAEGWPEP